MSTTKTFTTFDWRPYSTLSDKQKSNIAKYDVTKTWDELSKPARDLILKVYEKDFTPTQLKEDKHVQVFQFSVKTEFLEKCPEPETKQTEELFNTFNIASFVHNETGPALVNMVADRQEFYMNGKEVDAEMAKKMIHNNNFVTKFDKLISE